MSKQDRQGARTPAALERKYDFGQRFDNQDQKNKNQNAETSALASRLEAHIQSSNSSLARITQELAQAEAALSSLEGWYSYLRGDVDKSFAVLSQTVSGLVRAVAVQQETATALSTAAAQQAEQIARMETMLSFYDAKISEINAILAEITT